MSKLTPKFTPLDSPQIVAERLLKSVLPEELYLQLTATGEFGIEVGEGKEKHKYTFKRKGKTLVEREGKVYSCCIDVEDQKRPEQDRIVAEYLLVLNDEKKYLATANLTEVWSNRAPRTATEIRNMWLDEEVMMRNAPYIRYQPVPGEPPPAPPNEHILDAARYQLGVDWAIIGDTIQVRRPAQYRPVDNRITIGQIANQALWMLCRIPPFDRPYPAFEDYRFRGMMMNDTIFSVNFQFSNRDLEMSIDDFSARLLQPAVQQLAHAMAERHIEGFMELHLPQGLDMAARATMHDGRCLRLIGEYDIAIDQFRGRLDICPIIRR